MAAETSLQRHCGRKLVRCRVDEAIRKLTAGVEGMLTSAQRIFLVPISFKNLKMMEECGMLIEKN